MLRETRILQNSLTQLVQIILGVTISRESANNLIGNFKLTSGMLSGAWIIHLPSFIYAKLS